MRAYVIKNEEGKYYGTFGFGELNEAYLYPNRKVALDTNEKLSEVEILESKDKKQIVEKIIAKITEELNKIEKFYF